MLTEFAPDKIYLKTGRTDLRMGIDGLVNIIQNNFNLDPFSKTLFLFCGRKNDRIKGLYWDSDGFVLLYKRLEKGTYDWPRNSDEARLLSAQQYRWLMEGLKIDQPKAHKPIARFDTV